ncbi:MAG: NAD-dependent epimerase/dehydratase family protein [Planctomycetota bacterium]
MPLSKNTLLVTGAPGWLGDALLTQLGGLSPEREKKIPLVSSFQEKETRRAFRIRCLFQSQLPPEQLMAWRLEHPEVSDIIVGDLRDAEARRGACANLQGGSVLHAAGVIHPQRTSEWYQVNCDGALRLAETARAAGARRFVYVSSNAAQGVSTNSSVLLTEDMPCQPQSHYGCSKYQAEQGLLKLHEPGRFEVVIARPCMFYGPSMPDRHVKIFKRIATSRLPLVGGGRYSRSISYIDDLCIGLILCLIHPKASGEIFNLCDARAYTTREVCDAMASALGVTVRYLPLPAFVSTIAYSLDRALAAVGIYWMAIHLLGEANWNVGCSSRKATELLGFAPKMDIVEGYRRAVSVANEPLMNANKR